MKMDGDEMTERQDLVNQLRLDLLLRSIATTVLRRKFKEIYSRLNYGQEWTDGPASWRKFQGSKWGNLIHVEEGPKRHIVMGGNIQNWDLPCLQTVITQVLTRVRNEAWEQNISSGINSNNWRTGPSIQPTSIYWDPRWKKHVVNMSHLKDIRNIVSHMPGGTVSQGEFDQMWAHAVKAVKDLGAQQEEIDRILQITQFILNPQGQGQGQLSPVNGFGQKDVSCEAVECTEDETKIIEELQAEMEKLRLENQNLANKPTDEVRGQPTDETTEPVIANKKNESKALSLTKSGDSACRSGEWNKALGFYTKALEIPEISDDLRKKIYVHRSWVHLRILQTPEYSFNFDVPESDESENLKWPENLTQEVKECHLTAGIADAQSALDLSPGKRSPKALYLLAQFHQLKGDWPSALTYFDQALGQGEPDEHLESDRNVCQLEVLNQAEVEEFQWVPGQKNQTVAGLSVRCHPERWSDLLMKALRDPKKPVQLAAEVLKANFLAQGLSWEEPGQHHWIDTLEGREAIKRPVDFDEVVKLYEGAAKQGLPSGFYNLGLLLQEGNGVQPGDFYGAVRLFKMAAHFPIDDKTLDCVRYGILEAQYRLGLCYEFGLGVNKDEAKALEQYKKASDGDHARASRKLGDVYSKGLFGVAKDEDMAIFCWEQAGRLGDTVGWTSAALSLLESRRTWISIWYCLHSFSKAIFNVYLYGTPTMLTAALDRKRHFQTSLTKILYELTQSTSDDENEDQEPADVSWNIPAFVDHTLRTIHLLELVQTPEFQQKLDAIPNWRSEFVGTARLVAASNACIAGLNAFQELNKLYREALLKGHGGGGAIEMTYHLVGPEHSSNYPPDLRTVPGVDPATLVRENQLVNLILISFSTSIRAVGAAFFRDEPTQSLIHCLVKKFYRNREPVRGVSTQGEIWNYFNAALIQSYTLTLKGDDGQENLEILDRAASSRDGTPFTEPIITISAAAVHGSLGKFEGAVGDLEEAVKSLNPQNPFCDMNKCDLLYVQGLCCKSAALTRGVSSANRKKIREAMAIFQKFLDVCPKDEPRRAEAYYQLGLCTFYLEKMKIKGQVKSSADEILAKVSPLFSQGEAAEQELPWKEFPQPHKSPVKLFLQRKMMGLETLVQQFGALSLTSESSSEEGSEKLRGSYFGRFVDPFFKFPTSSFPLKLKEGRRVKVIREFRRFFKAAGDCGVGTSSSLSSPSARQLNHLLSLPGSPFCGEDVFTASIIVGCYEIVEPVLHCRFPLNNYPNVFTILAFTVVQDESGTVFNLQLTMKYRGDEEQQMRPYGMGARVIVHQPCIRLDVDGGTSLLVKDADEQIFHVAENGGNVTRKCGFCGKIEGTLRCCSRCKTVYYCGQECQKADWKELKHNLICSFLQSPLSPPSTPG